MENLKEHKFEKEKPDQGKFEQMKKENDHSEQDNT